MAKNKKRVNNTTKNTKENELTTETESRKIKGNKKNTRRKQEKLKDIEG